MQKIRTVELDGKVIKLQIVSAGGGCWGWGHAGGWLIDAVVIHASDLQLYAVCISNVVHARLV
jgi:hypothetical protein